MTTPSAPAASGRTAEAAPAHLLQVKAPEESRGPWDYARVAASLPGEEAFRPMSAGGCGFVTG
jgi:branched-chain amino acid transport system substrate-binding protein